MPSSPLDLDDPLQPFEQVAARIRAAIDAGDMEPGQQLKSIRVLAEEFGVSTGTVQRAVRALREEGLVTSWRGRGLFVRRKPDQVQAEGVEVDELRRSVEALTTRVNDIERQISELRR